MTGQVYGDTGPPVVMPPAGCHRPINVMRTYATDRDSAPILDLARIKRRFACLHCIVNPRSIRPEIERAGLENCTGNCPD
ncbi:hypothetical protein ALC56_02611 [Trachymyrmex septentrionalis]|uniref:Uncharacterized protein n=1 Tax=Trachymyrmex septentrionalis TaxID=34720 RepID=A0A195FSD1_9HYME|nr:hypothetical protein ALC56_02611 [Trachymyrmex septentrionalis]